MSHSYYPCSWRIFYACTVAMVGAAAAHAHHVRARQAWVEMREDCPT
jgi:hypothetical protein